MSDEKKEEVSKGKMVHIFDIESKELLHTCKISFEEMQDKTSEDFVPAWVKHALRNAQRNNKFEKLDIETCYYEQIPLVFTTERVFSLSVDGVTVYLQQLLKEYTIEDLLLDLRTSFVGKRKNPRYGQNQQLCPTN